MLMNIYGLRDIKANTFLPPIAAPSTGVLIRQLADMINTEPKQEPWAKWPQDFELYLLWEWDNETGMVHQEHKTQLCVLSSLKTN